MKLREFMRIVEIRTKIVSMSSFLIGTVAATVDQGVFSVSRFLVMAGAVLLVDMGTTAFNTYYDYRSGVDSPKFEREAEKVLIHAGVPAFRAFWISVVLYGLAIVFGAVLGFMVGPAVVVAGAVCMAVGFFYTAGPWPISRTALGELFAGGFLGLVLVVLSYYVQAQVLTTRAFLIGIPSLLMISSILTVNNTCDIDGDAAAGRRTLSILVGRKTGAFLVYLQGTLAYLWAIGLGVLEILPRASIIFFLGAWFYSVVQYRLMHRQEFGHLTKGSSMGAISSIFSAYSLTMLVSLALGFVL